MIGRFVDVLLAQPVSVGLISTTLIAKRAQKGRIVKYAPRNFFVPLRRDWDFDVKGAIKRISDLVY